MDLAKVGEVKHLILPLHYEELVDKKVNEYLKKGFVILSVKIAEERHLQRESDQKLHMVVQSSLVYIFGKPREKKEAPRSTPIDTSTNGLRKFDELRRATQGLREKK